MIGVAKYQSVRMFARMSRMSRKWTVSAARIKPHASVKMYCTTTTSGKHSSSGTVKGAWDTIRKTARIGSAKMKWTMFAVTVTIGNTSAGKSTFLIRLPPAMSTPDDSMSDAENHVQGRSPQNMNSGYGVAPCTAWGMTYVKTSV